MQATGQTEELRAGLRGMWASVAGGWDERADLVDARGADITERLVEMTAIEPGLRVLELACGPGGVGLAVAGLVGPDGLVVMSDVVPEMTAIAARRAQARGLANVEVRERDLEAIAEPDDSYDVVLCREGLMLVPDPARAASEIHRVLRPGGRAGIAVWGPRERNPWLGVLFDAVTATLGAPVPPPGIPGPFSLDDRDLLAGVLTGGGLRDVHVEELEKPMEVETFEMWWNHVTGLAGPLAKMLAALPDEPREAIRDRARSALSAYDTGEGLSIPGVTFIAHGRA
jgi:ubiquinone/menaquinone biosynthesis C-methylase UbiE